MTEHFYFQQYRSEDMQQTTEINKLLGAGPRAFWYLHIQPPVLDVLRYLLVLPDHLLGADVTGRLLDGRMYVLLILVYAAFNAIAYLWLLDLTSSTTCALVGTALWGLYPGNLAMATLLESTYLSAFLISLMLYLLYRFLRNPSQQGLLAWLASFVFITYTRSAYQIHVTIFIPLLVLIFQRRIPISLDRRKAVVQGSLLLLLLFALPVKQYALYRTLSSTSYAGQHLIEGSWYRPTPDDLASIAIPPRIIANAEQFISKRNSPQQVKINYSYEHLFRQLLVSHPRLVAAGIWRSVRQALWIIIIPTQNFQPNTLSDSLYWSPLSARIFGGRRYVALITASLGVIALSLGRRRLWWAMSTYWPLAFLFSVGLITIVVGSNRYDWTEAERLKFMYEMPLFLSIVWAVHVGLQIRHRPFVRRMLRLKEVGVVG